MEYKKYKLWFLTATLVVLWCIAAGYIANRYFAYRMQNVVEEQTRINDERADDLSDSIRRNVHYLGGIPELLTHALRVRKAIALFGANALPSTKSYEERKTSWTQNPTLIDLNQFLALTKNNLNVDLVYLVDAAGDAIASSNWDQSGSMIGTNFKERDFFLSNKVGKKGMQYAMGKTTRVPGLYFSSPVLVEGHFMGAVVAKIDVADLSFITKQTDAFVTDRNGVVILARDKSLEMQALPGAAVFGMTDQQKMAYYQRRDFAILPTSPWGSKEFPELLKEAGKQYPHLRVSSSIPEYDLTVHIDNNLEQLPSLEREHLLVFLLLAFFGSMFIASSSGIFLYLKSVKKSKDDLRESEERLSMAMKYAPDAVIICEQDGRIVYVNEQVVNLLGYSPEELIRMTVFDLVPADWREAYMQATKQILADDRHHVLEIRWVKKDGSKISMELNAVILPNGRVYGSCREITERKRLEKNLAESERRYRTLIESSPLCVHEIDLQGRFISMNRSGLEMLKLEDEGKICGIPFLSAVSTQDNGRILALFQKAINGTACHFEFTTPGDAPLYFKSCFIPITDRHGHVVKLMGLTEDITERKRTEILLGGQKKVLEMIASGSTLSETLAEVVFLIERQSPGILGSILLLDEEGTRVRHGAAPSLPEEYVAAIDGAPIGPRVGSCGTAAYRKEAVFVEDIATDPLWAEYKAVALPHGLRACWSTPIFDTQHRVIGTFAMYQRQPGLPQPEHLQLIDIATQSASIAISRHLMEKTLRKSEEAFRMLFESSHDAFMIFSPEQGFLDGNQAAIDLFGCRDELEFITLSPASVSPEFQPDGRRSSEKALEMMRLALDKGGHFFEWTHKRMDGKEFFADVLLACVEIDGKKLLHATVRDISKRKQADMLEQQRLDELEAIYLLGDAVGSATSLDKVYEVAMDFMLHLLKADRVAICLFDANGVMQFKAWQCITDAYRKSLDGHTIWTQDTVDPQPLIVEDIELDSRLAGLKPVITAEGISALGFFPMVQHGRLLGKFSVYFNTPHHFTESETQLALTITSHVSFAIDRKLAEQQFVDMFEFAPDAIVMTDMHAVITLINRQAEVLFGYSPDELIGQTIDILIPQDRSDQRREQRQRFLSSALNPRPLGTAGRKDLRAISKDGRIFSVELSLSQMESPNGKLIAAAVRDVSGRQQVLEELSQTADELASANIQIEEERARLAVRVLERTSQLLLANKAKDSFLATMSHEIRTPLGGLLGMMELLSLSKLDDQQIATLRVARSSGNSLLRIVDDILDWSKIEAGKLELAPHVSSIAEMIKGVASTYAQLASAKGIQLKQQVDDKLGAAHVFDPLRISQILNNFTSNAIKFTERGSVEIRAERVGHHNGSDEVRFSVKDSGVGIAPEQLSRLFQQYEQASNETARMYGGTGLGLAICRSLAELMDGNLSVESTPGIGTTFSFMVSLPVANLAAQRDLQLRLARDEGRENEPDTSLLGQEGQHLSVLVVDDHPVNRMLLKQQLEQFGLHVVVAESGMVGLSLWWTEHFDLIITDCHMPEMDGYEFTRNIREIERNDGKPQVPIIAWTANVLAEEEELCHNSGMDDLLTKPTELSDLRAMLSKWLVKTDALPAAGVTAITEQNPTLAESAIDFNVLKKFALSHSAQVEMLQAFDVHNRGDIANLIAVLKEGNPEAVAHSAHRIKGACRMVGALELESISARIELAAKQDDMQGAQAAADKHLEEAVARVEVAIGRFVVSEIK